MNEYRCALLKHLTLILVLHVTIKSKTLFFFVFYSPHQSSNCTKTIHILKCCSNAAAGKLDFPPWPGLLVCSSELAYVRTLLGGAVEGVEHGQGTNPCLQIVAGKKEPKGRDF